jgi:serine protease AprX
MKKYRLTFFACLLSTIIIAAPQEKPQKYWIYFSSKEHVILSKSASLREMSQLTGVSERALLRRTKVSQQTITQEDLPVSPSYLATLNDLGITVQNTSRWFNAATAYLTPAQREQLQQLSFVRSVEPIATYTRKELPRTESARQDLSKQTANQKYSYGSSAAQMTMINAIAVHNIGISGRGVLVGMLDTGFRWKNHSAMNNLNVISEYDFVQKDNNTANEANDAFDQDSHGTATMSLVGGFKKDTLVSSAFNADFILGKTEYVPTETNVEEDNWVAAIEWMELQGVDIVSSSLGYSTFDLGQKSYVYGDMDGRTATTSKAAVIAMRKGVVVVNAMGNEAQTSWHFLTSPADADSIVSVGAVNTNGTVTSFSSPGPTIDGRTKPDVSAQGVFVFAAVPSTSKSMYTTGFNGTSAATPLVAGVAALILSAHPELTPVQVRDALRTTANNANSPNYTVGWGIVNAYAAVLANGMVISTDPEISLTNDSNYSVGMFVVSKSLVKKDSVRLFYSSDSGATFSSSPMTLTDTVDAATHSGKYTAIIPKSSAVSRFYVRAVDATNISRTSPHKAPADLYDVKTGTTGVRPENPVPSSFALLQNYPNPFNPKTTIRYHLPRTSVVSLKVYNVLGKEIASLVNERQIFGSYSVPFNAAGLASGVYFYRLQADDFVETKKLMLLK